MQYYIKMASLGNTTLPHSNQTSSINQTNVTGSAEEEETSFYIFAVMSGLISFMAIFGNTLTLLAFIRNKKLRYFGNYFLISFCVTD